MDPLESYAEICVSMHAFWEGRTPTILNFSQGSVPHKHIPTLGESLSSPTAVCTGTRQETGLSSWTGRWPMASGTDLLVGLLGQLEKGLS